LHVTFGRETQPFPSAVAVMLGPHAAQSGPPFSKPIVSLNSSHRHRRPARNTHVDDTMGEANQIARGGKKSNCEPTVRGRHEIPAGVASRAGQGDRIEVLVVFARARIPVLEHLIVRVERTRKAREKNCDQRQATIAVTSDAIHICYAVEARRSCHADDRRWRAFDHLVRRFYLETASVAQ